METCRNCGNEFDQQFCPSCGEKKFKRIVAKDVLSDFTSNLLTFEGPVLRTFKDLTMRPGRMVRNYLDGRRKVYAKPVQYYLLALSINLLFFYIYGEESLNYSGQTSQEVFGATPDENAAQAMEQLNEDMVQVQLSIMQFINIIQVPIYALFMFLFFRRSDRKYMELFAAMLYLLGHILYFSIITTLMHPIHPAIGLIGGLAISILYLGWASTGLFDGKKWLIWIKSFAVFVCTMFVFMICVTILSFAVYIIQHDRPSFDTAEGVEETTYDQQSFPVLLDTFDRKTTTMIVDEVPRANYSMYYIGTLEDTTTLTYNTQTVPLPPPTDPPGVDPIGGSTRIFLDGHDWSVSFNEHYERDPPDWAWVDTMEITIVVDTLNVIGNVNLSHYQDGTFKFNARPVLIINENEDTLIVGTNRGLPIIAEALDSTGTWVPIEKNQIAGCGTGQMNLFLPPGEVIITSSVIYAGDVVTKIRLKVGKSYSNEFTGSVFSHQLEN